MPIWRSRPSRTKRNIHDRLIVSSAARVACKYSPPPSGCIPGGAFLTPAEDSLWISLAIRTPVCTYVIRRYRGAFLTQGELAVVTVCPQPSGFLTRRDVLCICSAAAINAAVAQGAMAQGATVEGRIRLAQTSTVTNCMMTCNAQAANCQTGCVVPGTPPTASATTTSNATAGTTCLLTCTSTQIACQTTCARQSPSQ
jgi:hypothetical protein